MRLPVAVLFSFATNSSLKFVRFLPNASAFVSPRGTVCNTVSRTRFYSMSTTTTTFEDAEFPGTAVERLHTIRARVQQLVENNEFTGSPWHDIRRRLLWAGGLCDLPDAAPGEGYTGHCFNDWNHVDLTPIADSDADNENRGQVPGIARGNRLGAGIRIASLPELGPGGSWTTCAAQNVANLQFQARIAFRLVWVPNQHYNEFVLVDDQGALMAHGTNLTGGLPHITERQANYQMVKGTKYAIAADKIASNVATAAE
jgi:hypothetical protein